MKKLDKVYTCKNCKVIFTQAPRPGRDPQYCSDKCRGKIRGPIIWNLVCRECKKEWTMQRGDGGRKPHFCPECYPTAWVKRHNNRQRQRDRSYKPKEDVEEKQMVKWVSAAPLITALAYGHIKEEDWSIATSRDRSLITYMAERLGIQYSSMTRYLKPNAKIKAYLADEFAIRLRPAPNAYLGNGLLC